MKHKFLTFLSAAFVLFALSSCDKKDKPVLGEYDTDDNQVLIPGDLRFFASFDATDGVSPRWNAGDSISSHPALLFPVSYEPGITGNAIRGKDNAAVLYLDANDLKAATTFSISLWLKNTPAPGRAEFIFSLVDNTYNGWSRSGLFLMMEGQATDTAIMKMGVMDQWLEGTLRKPLFDGNWHHMVFAYDPGTSKMNYYFDGAPIAGMVAKQTDVLNGGNPRGALNYSAASNLILGGWNKHVGKAGPTDDWVKSYTGLLDQFRIYNKTLTPAEVQALYVGKL